MSCTLTHRTTRFVVGQRVVNVTVTQVRKAETNGSHGPIERVELQCGTSRPRTISKAFTRQPGWPDDENRQDPLLTRRLRRQLAAKQKSDHSLLSENQAMAILGFVENIDFVGVCNEILVQGATRR